MDHDKRKIMIIGLDAPIAHRVYEFAAQGLLPSIRKLIDAGTYTENCLVPYPTITSSNWTTIATGAWPGTHGITGYSVHLPGDPLDSIHDGFDSGDRQAETIWEAAARSGKRSIVIDWPASWPESCRETIVLGGGGVGVNSWRVAHHNQRRGVTLGSYQLLSTEEYPFATKVEFTRASGWEDLPIDRPAMEATVELNLNAPPEPAANQIEPKHWRIVLLDTAGEGYDRAILSESKSVSNAFADLRVGEWSNTIVQEFETPNGKEEGCFKCKLLNLSADGKVFKLYVTIINARRGWSHPQEIAGQISSGQGLPSPRDGYFPFLLGWIDADTLAELADFQHLWLADAAGSLLADHKWDVFLMHAHCPDWMYHTFSRELDPSRNPDSQSLRTHSELEIRLYQSLDRMLGRLLEFADENTLVVITSDHGAKAGGREFRVAQVLADAGLTVMQKDPALQSLDVHAGTSEGVDWSRTKAFAQRSCYIYINTKGRDPDGIVEPGEEYEHVRDQVIELLYDYTDPETGKKPVSLALRREDARILGLYGERVGDVVYALNPEFGGEHGNFLPAAGHGIGSMKGLLIISGPGVARGRRLERNVWLTDIVPTLCHLAEIPVPRQAEGGIIYQALEDPDIKLAELQRLRENYRRVMRAFSSGEAETHRRGQ